MAATDRLKTLRTTANWLETASQDLWWTVFNLFARQVRADPVLSASFPADPALHELMHPTDVPPDLEQWAIRAFLSLERYLDPTHGSPGNRIGQVRAGKWGHHWEERDRATTYGIFIKPIMIWLELQAGQVAEFHTGVDRWIRRLRWFGSTGSTEEFYQEDLARFLFDAGLDFEEVNREAHSAGGRVDFLLRGDLLIPVELKLWRGSHDSHRLSHDRAPAQAARYARDFRVPRSYLVVVCPVGEERLDLPPAGHTGDGIELLIRTAEVRPPSPSQDHRLVVGLTLDQLRLSP